MSKILVADDSKFQVALLKSALEAKGFEVVSAMDAAQTTMLAVRQAPDAIVLDINMPGGSGIEVLKRLKHSTKTKHIPVVIASGTEDADVLHVATQLGVSACFPKPVDTDKLCETLKLLVETRSSAAAAGKH